MPAQGANCPFCDQGVRSSDQACPSCGKPFPWAAEIARLEDEIKSREPNRVRATLALAEEIFAGLKGDRPVSAAALKGFITAWLMPRAVLVLGSLIGGATLIAQTVILWQQTGLLAMQAASSRLEQEQAISARILDISEKASRLTALTQHYRLIQPLFSELPARVPATETGAPSTQTEQDIGVTRQVLSEFAGRPTFLGDDESEASFYDTVLKALVTHCRAENSFGTDLAGNYLRISRATQAVVRAFGQGEQLPVRPALINRQIAFGVASIIGMPNPLRVDLGQAMRGLVELVAQQQRQVTELGAQCARQLALDRRSLDALRH